MSKLKVELVRHEDGNPEHEELVLELSAEFSGSKKQLNALLKDDVSKHQLYEAVEESFEAHRGKGGKDVPRCARVLSRALRTTEEIQELPYKDGFRFYLAKNRGNDEYVEYFAVEPTFHLGLNAWTNNDGGIHVDAVEEGVKTAVDLFEDLVGLLMTRRYWKRENQAGTKWEFSCQYASEEMTIYGQCDP